MRVSTLPSPGRLATGVRLRIEAAKAISSVEIVTSAYPGGVSGQASKLHAFFTACANALTALRDVVLPTVTAVNVSNSSLRLARVRFSEAMDHGVLSAASAFVFTPARVIENVYWADERQDELVISVTTDLTGVTNLAYTAPGVNALRDFGGNLLATDATTPLTFA